MTDIKYEYEAKFGLREELYEMEVDEKNINKRSVKNKLNETFIYGELEPKQYFIYQGGEQEDKEKYK